MSVSKKLFTMTLVCLDELRICPSGFISSLWLFSHQTTTFKRTKKQNKCTATKGRQPPPCSSLNIIVVDLNSKSSPSFLIFLIIPTISFDNIKRKEARYANKACLSIYLSVPTLTTLDWMIIKFKKKKTTSSPIFSLEYISQNASGGIRRHINSRWRRFFSLFLLSIDLMDEYE